MTVTIYAVKHSPNGIETIKLDNVASYEVNDNGILVKFNGEEDQYFNLVNTETQKFGCWYGLTIFSEKVALKTQL